jgi:hypothetical protein
LHKEAPHGLVLGRSSPVHLHDDADFVTAARFLTDVRERGVRAVPAS